MESTRPSSRPGNQEKHARGNGHFIPRPRTANSERGHRNGAHRISEENRLPPNLPRSFHSMLKTSTETGDIGMFSIKPSRIPQALNSPQSNSMSYLENAQKPRHNFQPHGVPLVDDRRRLPSYKDTTSEVIAMHESSGQRLGYQIPQDSDHRSRSMTQTSSYTLSNHRSFASLRSQQEGNALLQRPRSPFAYPARLKRPGVRPSSPALTDGGLVDYSRRAEIERFPLGHGHSTTLPGSLHAQRRRIFAPYYQRSEANRSTPSLLSQQSPPRHSSNPNLRQSVGSQGDWPRRPILRSGNTSPARSARSYASTVNLYTTGAPASTTTTPGKLHPPSPLYYDYTEDFGVDDYNQPKPQPPPTFCIGHSTPEEAPSSIQVPPTTTIFDSRIPVVCSRPKLRNSVSAASILQRSFESITSSKGSQDTSVIDSFPKEDLETPKEQFSAQSVDFKRDTKVKRHSGQGYSLRELSTHVEEVSGPTQILSREQGTPTEFENGHESQHSADEEMSILKSGFDEMSARSSLYSLTTNLQQFPRPPGSHLSSTLREMTNTTPDDAIETTDNQNSITRSRRSQSSASVQNLNAEMRSEDMRPVARKISRGKKRPSLVDSLDMGFEELDQLIVPSFGSTNGIQNYQNIRSPQDDSSHISWQSANRSGGIEEHDSQQGAQTEFRARHIDRKPGGMSDQPQTRVQLYQRERQVELSPEHRNYDLGNVPNFSHQIASQLMPRPDSPMIAPKPISPARQLRLRNSIPQIMKALPPLLLDPPICAGLLGKRLLSFDPEHQLLPKLIDPSTPVREPQKTPQPSSIIREDHIDRNEESRAQYMTQLVERVPTTEKRKSTSRDTENPAPPLPRLKLRTRRSSSRPLSPPDVRPWNMEESYPWSSQNVDVELPPPGCCEEGPISALPKFRLKVTRATNSSQGTIIVSRESNESKHLGGAHMRNPKDLFTPASGLDNIFRQVGKHLHTRTSESINSSETESPVAPLTVLRQSVIIREKDAFKSESEDKPGITALTVVAQSTFSDDSSHIIYVRQKLRTRLSNLRARMSFHYAYRATHSSDDVIWERRSEDPQTPHILRSAPNLNSARAAFSERPQRTDTDKLQKGKLRGKVRGWLRGAKTAIIGPRRSRSSQKSDDERAHLTPFD